MKKIFYLVCVLLLIFLIVHEIQRLFPKSEAKVSEAEPVKKTNASGKENQKPQKVAYLTFDDGPSDNTEKVLKTLKEKNAVATFFLIGNEITEEREETVKKAIEQGNAIGVHTYCHEQKVMYRDEESFFDDYQKAAGTIQKITGERPTLHRFPWGSNNGYIRSFVDDAHQKLTQMGVKSFDWNVSGEDSVGRHISGWIIMSNIKKDLTKYDTPIILLHDSAGMDRTAEVLGDIIDYIRSQGYTFATLTDREEYLFPVSWR